MQDNDSNEDEPDNLPKIFGLKNSYKEDQNQIINNQQKMEEILSKTEEEGLILPYQSEMMKKILKLELITVSDIMTHRINIKAVEKNSTKKEVLKLCFETKFSKIPVFEKDIDNIIGVVYLKDLLKETDNTKDSSLEKYIKKPLFIPTTMKVETLFKLFYKEKKSVAVIVDEYGGTSGIISLNDIAKFIFGEIYEEDENYKENLVVIDDVTTILDGDSSLEETCQALDITIKENSNYTTIGGFLIDVLGRIPQQGENPTVNYNGVEFKILSVDNQHINKIRAVKIK